MRRYLIGAACALLAACGSAEAPVNGGPAQQAGVERAPAESANAEMAGTYEVTAEDGTVVRQTLDADGTYRETLDGSEIERGTWHQKGEQMCYDPQGDAIEQCYTGGQPDADGSFSVETDGGTASVRRLGDAEAAEPAAASDTAE
tara:strand:- start:1647 stop:2081 length:435 start_codon:yes stop_codon:yes gene_type:complete